MTPFVIKATSPLRIGGDERWRVLAPRPPPEAARPVAPGGGGRPSAALVENQGFRLDLVDGR